MSSDQSHVMHRVHSPKPTKGGGHLRMMGAPIRPAHRRKRRREKQIAGRRACSAAPKHAATGQRPRRQSADCGATNSARARYSAAARSLPTTCASERGPASPRARRWGVLAGKSSRERANVTTPSPLPPDITEYRVSAPSATSASVCLMRSDQHSWGAS